MRTILLGAPCAGKGTIAKLLVDEYNIIQISTGDILRKAITDKTKIGKKADEYIKRGDIDPDPIIMDIMEDRLQEKDYESGFVLDGFPRTIEQAESLDKILTRHQFNLDAVVNLEVPDKILISRLTSRRTCSNPDCQAIYNILHQQPKKEGICDRCQNPLIQRDDETEEAIRHRLKTYQEKTAPLIDYYKKEIFFVSSPALESDTVFDTITHFVNNTRH